MEIMKKTMDFFVQTKDVDFNDTIHPTAILDMFQDLAGLHAAELGVGFEELRKKNYAWVVLYQRFEIECLPPYLDYVTLETWPKPKHRLEFEREYHLKNKQGRSLIKGISNWVIIDLNTRGLVRSDKIIFNGEFHTVTNFPEKCKRKLNLNPNGPMEYFHYEVKSCDLDHNGHMNNARYLNIIFNYLMSYGDKKYIKTAEIAYIKEATFKDIIQIGHYTIDKQEAFLGFVNDELCFECLIGEDTL